MANFFSASTMSDQLDANKRILTVIIETQFPAASGDRQSIMDAMNKMHDAAHRLLYDGASNPTERFDATYEALYKYIGQPFSQDIQRAIQTHLENPIAITTQSNTQPRYI